MTRGLSVAAATMFLFTAMALVGETPQSADAMLQAGGTAPMVTISKRCPSLRYLGRNATFEIVVANQGNGMAHNVTVTDVISGNIQFVSADNNGSHQGNNVVWRLDTLGPGQTRTLTATYRCNQIGQITNRATVSYCAEASDECVLEVKGIPAILLECVDDPDPIEVGGTLTYTITVLNQGTAVGTNIRVNCTLPPEEELVRAEGPTAGAVSGKSIKFAPLPTLAPKARAMYKLQVKGVGVGDVRFRVELLSDQITKPVMETESSNIYE